MKYQLLLCSLILLSLLPAFASGSDVELIENSTWGTDLEAVSWSSIALGDIDNDDDLDLVVTGCSVGSVQSCNVVDNARIYINNGTSLVESSTWEQNMTGVGWSSVALGDIDNDGDLDLVISGDKGGKNGIVKIYANNGTSFLENSTWQQNLTNVDVYAGAVALGDIDNDGDLDLGLIGALPASDNGIYINDGTTFVKNSTWVQLPRVGHRENNGAHIAFGDVDNNGKLDLLMVGSYNVDFYRGVYINNGTSLVENSTWEQDFNPKFGKSSHSIALHDWNNDGLLDFSCIGLRAGDHFYIYQNIGTRFTVNSTEDSGGSACFPGVYDGATSWGDYDNDGDLDVVLIGMEVGRARVIEQGIDNPWGCTFAIDNTAHANISNKIVRGSMAWGDIDKDGDLDLIITGDDDTTEIAKVYINNGTIKNTNSNAANSNFNTAFNFSTGKLTLTWGNGSDSETPTLGLYYNLRVGTCSGCHDVVSGVFGSGDVNGYFGNMMQRKSIKLNRPDLENKTTYWAVQTIDTGLAKSTWSTEQIFEITQSCTENWVYGDWGTCAGEQQMRTATDLNGCGTEENKSETLRSCTVYTPPSGGGNGPIILPPKKEDNETIVDNNIPDENTTNISGDITGGINIGSGINKSNQSVQICLPFELRCEGDNLLECIANGSVWTVKMVCKFGCGDGRCKERPSEPINYVWIVLPIIIIIVAIAGIYLIKIRKPGTSGASGSSFS